jgi:purine-nucleoside phosphorylase
LLDNITSGITFNTKAAVMSNMPIKDILFIRKYLRFFEKTSHLKKQLQSIISSRGATTHYAGHDITFLFLGYGKKQRMPHQTIIEKLNSGKITDIVDIGGGGALDPTLKRGDLILSAEDIPFDTLQPLKVRRRKEIQNIVQALANKKQRRFFERKILTSAKIIASKKERIALYNQTQCSIVQMEHCWFLQALQNVMEPQSFSNLYITHIEIVADVVQQRNAFLNNFLELFHGINYCILLNQHYIGKVKSDFLKLWLKSEEYRASKSMEINERNRELLKL